MFTPPPKIYLERSCIKYSSLQAHYILIWTFFVQWNQGPGFENSGVETPSQVDLGRGGEHIYIYIYIHTIIT